MLLTVLALVVVRIAYLGNEDPTKINGPILVFSSIIQNVMASIGEAEYAAAFHTGQMASGIRKTLFDLAYPQPPTYILAVSYTHLTLPTIYSV